MAKMSISMEVFKDSATLAAVTEPLGALNISDTCVNRITNPSHSFVLAIAERMRATETVEPTATGNQNELCYRILTAAGCSLIRTGPQKDPKYSLMTDQIDTETVDNPNKIETGQFVEIEKVTIPLASVFNNEFDSFFKLDSKIPDNYMEILDSAHRKIQESAPKEDVVNWVIKVLNMNLNAANQKTIRGFLGI